MYMILSVLIFQNITTYNFNIILAEVHGVALGIKNNLKKEYFDFFSICYPRNTPTRFPQKINPFGPAVLPARGNIYTNILFIIKIDRR